MIPQPTLFTLGEVPRPKVHDIEVSIGDHVTVTRPESPTPPSGHGKSVATARAGEDHSRLPEHLDRGARERVPGRALEDETGGVP